MHPSEFSGGGATVAVIFIVLLAAVGVWALRAGVYV